MQRQRLKSSWACLGMCNVLLLVAFILLITGTKICAQAKGDYAEALQKADVLREKGDLDGAFLQYQALGRTHPKNVAIMYRLSGTKALLAVGLEAYKDALEMLKKALSHDHYLEGFIHGAHSGDFMNLLLALERQELQELSHEIETVFNQNFPLATNTTLAYQLWKIYIRDQAYYWHIAVGGKKISVDSPIVMAIWDLKHLLNREDQIQLDEIIAQHGWPKFSEVGKVAKAACLVIQHASTNEIRKKYLPLLEAACKEGEADWRGYALMYDRIMMNETGNQFYGSQLRTSPDKNWVYEFVPIEDIEHLNERRRDKGLEPIEDYAARFNIDWKAYLLRVNHGEKSNK